MRLVHYINEEKLYKYLIPKIKENCSQYINDIRGAKGCLVRDDRKKKDWMISKHKTREIRVPTDTPLSLSTSIDKLFEKKFGWRVRSENSLFCYTTRNELINNIMRYVFPVGNYKIVWNKDINDLYRELFKSSTKKKLDILLKHDEDPEVLETLFNYFKNKLLIKYTNKRVKEAVKYDTEVMVNCKEYYLVHYTIIDEVNDALNLKWNFLK